MPGGLLPYAQNSNSCKYAANRDLRVTGNLGSKIEIDLVPDRHELFLLGEGEKKITFEPETRTYKTARLMFCEMAC